MAFNSKNIKKTPDKSGCKYKIVACNSLNVRLDPDPQPKGNNIVSAISRDNVVIHQGREYTQSDGHLWIEISCNEKRIRGWCNRTYLQLIDDPNAKKEATKSTTETSKTKDDENKTSLLSTTSKPGKGVNYKGYESTFENISYGQSALRETIINCKNAFGAPFLFLQSTDPVYNIDGSSSKSGNNKGKDPVKIGRVTLKTLYSNPRVFSICPGKVNYLPDSSKDSENLKESLGKLLLDATSENDFENDHLSGTLYDFASNYNDYMNRFNLLARASAILFGLGSVNMPGTTIPLSDYDWSYYSTDKRHDQYASNYKPGEDGILYGNQKGIKGQINKLFENIQASGAVATNLSYEYLHFFLMNESTSKNEDFSTSKTQSILAQYNDSVNSAVKNLRFLFNLSESEAAEGLMTDMQQLTAAASNNNESTLLGSFAGLAHGYLKGGTLVLPEIIDDVSYSDTISAHMKFVSPYGDKLSCFISTIIPSLALLNFVIPKQVSRNMYTYPYIIKAYQQGWYNIDLAIVENLRIERGGPDNTAWSVDGIATEIDVTFDIVPLHSSMMSPSSTDPLLFMSNTPLIQYLGNLCGLDLKSNLLATKEELFKQMLTNAFTDVPAQTGRQVGNWFSNKVKGIFNY